MPLTTSVQATVITTVRRTVIAVSESGMTVGIGMDGLTLFATNGRGTAMPWSGIFRGIGMDGLTLSATAPNTTRIRGATAAGSEVSTEAGKQPFPTAGTGGVERDETTTNEMAGTGGTEGDKTTTNEIAGTGGTEMAETGMNGTERAGIAQAMALTASTALNSVAGGWLIW